METHWFWLLLPFRRRNLYWWFECRYPTLYAFLKSDEKYLFTQIRYILNRHDNVQTFDWINPMEMQYRERTFTAYGVKKDRLSWSKKQVSFIIFDKIPWNRNLKKNRSWGVYKIILENKIRRNWISKTVLPWLRYKKILINKKHLNNWFYFRIKNIITRKSTK